MSLWNWIWQKCEQTSFFVTNGIRQRLYTTQPLENELYCINLSVYKDQMSGLFSFVAIRYELPKMLCTNGDSVRADSVLPRPGWKTTRETRKQAEAWLETYIVDHQLDQVLEEGKNLNV